MSGWVRTYAPVAGVIAAYVASAAIVVAAGVVPIVDEWMYIRAAEGFAATGSVEVSPMSVPTAIFEALYGGVLVSIVGSSHPLFVWASVLLASLSGVALYDLILRSGAARSASAAATAAYLFSPAVFGLSMTYMTDGHAVALVVIGAAALSRGVDRDGPRRVWWLIGGSVFVTLAYLSRPATIAVLIGALAVLASQRRWRALAAVAVLPGLVVAGHLFAQFGVAMPGARAQVLSSVDVPPLMVLRDLMSSLVLTVGIWLLVLVPPVAVAVWRNRSDTGVRVRLMAMVIVAFLPVLVWGFPQIGDWLNVSGMLPLDSALYGTRGSLMNGRVLLLMFLGASVILAFVFSLDPRSGGGPSVRSAVVGLWAFALGSITLSIAGLAATNGSMLDRYVIALMPAVLLTVACRLPNPIPRPALVASAVLGVVLAATVTVMTMDAMRIQQSVFANAQTLIADGAAADEVDAGAAWTGLMLGDRVVPSNVVLPVGEAWWRRSYGGGFDPRFVISLSAVEGWCLKSTDRVPQVVGDHQLVHVYQSDC